MNCITAKIISEYPLNFENGFTSGEVIEGETLYAAAFYSAHVENLIINGLFATSVFIVVSMTIDRYFKRQSINSTNISEININIKF